MTMHNQHVKEYFLHMNRLSYKRVGTVWENHQCDKWALRWEIECGMHESN